MAKLMSEKVVEQILAIRDSGLTNMFDIPVVKKIAKVNGFAELEKFLAENKGAYCEFIMFGKTC